MSKKDITVVELGTTVAPVSISGTSARSAALTTGMVRLQPTVDGYIKFGDSNVTATTSDAFVFGGGCYDLAYTGTNVAMITSGATGTLNITNLI